MTAPAGGDMSLISCMQDPLRDSVRSINRSFIQTFLSHRSGFAFSLWKAFQERAQGRACAARHVAVDAAQGAVLHLPRQAVEGVSSHVCSAAAAIAISDAWCSAQCPDAGTAVVPVPHHCEPYATYFDCKHHLAAAVPG